MKSAKKSTTTKTAKGEQTKALILSTALEMLHERGYEQTTMRAIAEKAGVSLGNAYHYFGSKDHLIQAFYHRTHEDHLRASLPALEKESSLKARLLSVMRLKIDTLEPYHEFAGVLFQTAADPHSPLNPFAHAAAPVRRDSIKLFEQLVEETKARIPERSARGVALPALALSHGDHSFLDPRFFTQARAHLPADRSDS